MAIFDVQHPLVLTFGLLGNFVSVIVYVAPVPTFIQIYRNKSTLGFQSLPYVVALFSSMLWMYYAFLKPNAILLISINSIGCIVETIYIAIYLTYATNQARKHTAKLIGCLNVGLFSAILIVTLFLVKSSHRVRVVGWICVAISVSVFAAPLSVVVQVVRTRSVQFLPIALSFWLTLSAVMWFTYGMLLKDLCIALPNVFGFILGMIQMVLYGFYRNAKLVAINEENQLQEERVINIVILEGPEVARQSTDEANKTPAEGQNGNKTDNEDDEEEEEYQQKKNESSRSMEEAAVHEPCKVSVQLLNSPVLITCVA